MASIATSISTQGNFIFAESFYPSISILYKMPEMSDR